MSLPTPPPEDDPFARPPEGTTPPPPAPATPPPPPPGYAVPPPAYAAPPPGYGTPQPGYGAYAAPENGQGTTALVTGVLGLLCCGLLSIVAIVTGRRGVALADAGRANNRGTAQAGMILGWIGVALWLFGIVVAIIVSATSSSSTFGAG